MKKDVKLYDKFVIHSTSSAALNGTFVMVTGISADFAECCFYIVEREDGEFFYRADGSKWKSIVLTEHCLRSIAPESKSQVDPCDTFHFHCRLGPPIGSRA